MFPNILLFYPEAARAILEYRIRTLEGALCNAQEQGYEVETEVLGRGPCNPAATTQEDSWALLVLSGSSFSWGL